MVRYITNERGLTNLRALLEHTLLLSDIVLISVDKNTRIYDEQYYEFIVDSESEFVLEQFAKLLEFINNVYPDNDYWKCEN